MSKIKLKEIADAIREKDGTTEPIIANDFATRIRAISGSEDLTTELDAQDELLATLEIEIDKLPNAEPEIKPVTYGVKIDLANSNPETSVTYTDDAVGFDKSYMDFTNDTFVYGSWQDKFPFNQVKPCLFKDGAVVKYLNPDNYALDVDGNSVDITGADGDVMIEIPKVYYRLHNNGNYQYIQISDMAQEGFCCLAHTYKGVEKDKVYIGAYQSYYDGDYSRSISGVLPSGEITLPDWRTYAQAQGDGYENFYFNLLTLLQCLFVIQFKHLNSQEVMGAGWVNDMSYIPCGGLNTKGLNYCASTTNAQMKWLGIEDFWGNFVTFIDGLFTLGDKLFAIDTTNPNMAYSDGPEKFNILETGIEPNSGYISEIIGNNASGFIGKTFTASLSTYYCDLGAIVSDSNALMRPVFGGSGRFMGSSYGNMSGAFAMFIIIVDSEYSAGHDAGLGSRLVYCG